MGNCYLYRIRSVWDSEKDSARKVWNSRMLSEVPKTPDDVAEEPELRICVL
jgi:hypothetical protein